MDSGPESDRDRDPTNMSPEEIDSILRRLGAVVDLCVTQWRAAGQAVPEVRDAHNPALAPGRDLRWPDPEQALIHAQWVQAAKTSRSTGDMAREFAAWWADAATVAMLGAVKRMPVDAVRVNAGDPSRTITGDDLDRLTELLAQEGIYPLHLAETATPRRDQLWGEVWTDHMLPRLPAWDELLDVLNEAGVRVDRMAELARGLESIANALAAGKEAGTGKAANEEPLSDHAAQLTDLLVDYARRVTDLLPHLRPTD